MSGVLDGLKVVSMEHYVIMPHASVVLADWGAEVISVEPVTGQQSRVSGVGTESQPIKVGGIDVDPRWEFLNRNKKSLAVDLKKESGRDILCQLVQKADVFMSNYESSALEKLRLDYDTLIQLNPRLIYAVVTGFGSVGPDKDERAFDQVASWAHSGIAYLSTVPGSIPPNQPGGMGDRNASVSVIAGILGALLHREKTGEGQKVECSLYHCALWSISRVLQAALSGLPQHPKSHTEAPNPIENHYRTKDDRWLQFHMTRSDIYWPDFCRAIERPELENDPRFNSMKSRGQNHEELIRILDEVFASKTMDEWEKVCRKHRLVHSRVQTLEEVVNDPQAWVNNFFVELHHPAGTINLLASPVKFYQNPASVRSPAPLLGEHNEQLLLGLGYSREDIAQLREQGVIL